MPTITELIEQAESLLRKKIAIKESVPGVFEALSNVDDQLRITINEIISSGLDGDLTQAQVRLINTALVGTRTAIATYQADYRPNVNDLTAEFTILPQINLRELRKLKEINPRFYEALIKDYGVIRETDFSNQELNEEDLNFLNNKEAVYEVLNYSGFSKEGYINDDVWYNFVRNARSGKFGALWGTGKNLSLAAKLMQERYGFEFNVKFLEFPKSSENEGEEAMPF
jgi:nitrogenase molybdenum-iron protein alpha/beta subunit